MGNCNGGGLTPKETNGSHREGEEGHERQHINCDETDRGDKMPNRSKNETARTKRVIDRRAKDYIRAY
jgi:hypothetical protein